MEFTNEEKKWLVSIEVPEDGKLTVMEERLQELAKPKTAAEAQLFQILASIRFGLVDPVFSDLDMKICIKDFTPQGNLLAQDSTSTFRSWDLILNHQANSAPYTVHESGQFNCSD